MTTKAKDDDKPSDAERQLAMIADVHERIKQNRRECATAIAKVDRAKAKVKDEQAIVNRLNAELDDLHAESAIVSAGGFVESLFARARTTPGPTESLDIAEELWQLAKRLGELPSADSAFEPMVERFNQADDMQKREWRLEFGSLVKRYVELSDTFAALFDKHGKRIVRITPPPGRGDKAVELYTFAWSDGKVSAFWSAPVGPAFDSDVRLIPTLAFDTAGRMIAPQTVEPAEHMATRHDDASKAIIAAATPPIDRLESALKNADGKESKDTQAWAASARDVIAAKVEELGGKKAGPNKAKPDDKSDDADKAKAAGDRISKGVAKTAKAVKGKAAKKTAKKPAAAK